MIRSKTEKTEIVIDLDGPEGNAYALLGYAKSFSKKLGFDYKEIEEKMTSGDYENLIKVFDSYFGSFVVLERSK